MLQVSVGEMLFGWGAPTERTLRNRIIGFIELQRPVKVAIAFFRLALSAAALVGARLDDPRLPIGMIMVYLLAAANLVIND